MPKHHIIIGDGVTAAEFATSRPSMSGEKITIIGNDVAKLGRGVAYACETIDAPWRYAYLLNSPVRSVDVDFSNWISTHWEYLVERMSGRSPDWLEAAKPYVNIGEFASLNVPREIYGDFVHAQTIERLYLKRQNGVDINLLSARAVHIQTEAHVHRVTTEDGQQLIADSIDVATGGPQIQRFEGDDADNSFPQLYGNEYRIADILEASNSALDNSEATISGAKRSNTQHSPSNKSVVCIGAGAAMLDVLRFCQSIQAESQMDFTAISTNGKILPALRPGDTFNPAQYQLSGTYSSAEEFLDAIKACQQQALALGHNFYETRVGLRSLFVEKSLTDFVPSISEARKIANPLFNLFQGTARDCIDDFNRLAKTGNARCLAGRVTTIVQHADSALVHYTDSAGIPNNIHADVVVNCAGPGSNNKFDELTASMLRKEWISICEHSGGILVGENGQTTINGIRYLGPAVTSIGDNVQQVPLYDAYRLRMAVQEFNASIAE